MARDFRGGKEKWASATITRERTPGIMYDVETTDGCTWKRHANQLIAGKPKIDAEAREIATSQQARNNPLKAVPRRSERIRSKQINNKNK